MPDCGKWKGRSTDCPAGPFPEAALLSASRPSLREPSLKPDAPLFEPDWMFFTGAFGCWSGGISSPSRCCRIITSTMGRVSPKRRNCLRSSSCSRGVAASQRSNTPPSGCCRNNSSDSTLEMKPVTLNDGLDLIKPGSVDPLRIWTEKWCFTIKLWIKYTA